MEQIEIDGMRMYIFCFFILALLLLVFPFDTKNGYGKYFLPFSFITLFIFSAFRFTSGSSDYMVYSWMIVDSYDIPLSWIIQQNEMLSLLLYKFVAVVFHDPLFYFIISSVIIFRSYFIFARRFIVNEKFFVIAFFCAYGYSASINITRQFMAGSIILLGILFLLDYKRKNAFVLFFIACLIHDSSYLILPLLLLLKIKFTNKVLSVYATVTAIAVPLVVFLLPYIQKIFYSDYVSGSYGVTKANVFNIALIIPVVISVFILVSKLNDKELSMLFNNDRRLIDFTLHGSMMYIFFIIVSCGYALILARFACYFIPFALLAIDRCFLMMKERNLRFIYQLSLFLFVCSFFIVMQYGRNNTVETTFIWQVENRPVVENIQ